MPLPTLQSILGQDSAITWLQQAYRTDRLPHGLIFGGPAGVGKGTTARALAALHLCLAPNGTAPCGTCDSCRVLAADNHPDFAVVHRKLIRQIPDKEDLKATLVVVDVIREFLVRPASLKPALGRGRVFIVEEAELMNAAAQNSLLKTLEEPHPRTLIVLITDHPESLLPTIRSRTQLVRFQALDPALVARELTNRGIDKATAQLAAELSDGSIGTSLTWIEDGVVANAQQLLRQLDDLLAGRPVEGLADWFKGAAEAYAKRQADLDPKTSADHAKRQGLSLYLRLAAQRFRGVLRDAGDAREFDQACTAIEAIARADDYLEGNVNIPIIFQQLALTLTRLTAA